jgi:hypothetical protein
VLCERVSLLAAGLFDCFLVYWSSVRNRAKTFLRSKFSYLFFSNPTHKSKTGLQIGGRLLIANHHWSIRNKERHSDHIYYTLLWQVHSFAAPFTSLGKLYKTSATKPFC